MKNISNQNRESKAIH